MLFKEITGQTEIKNRLIKSVKDQRVSHAQLFLGPEGSGKLPLAIAYAQFINCKEKKFYENSEDGLTGDSCGVCPSCQKFNHLAHPDLHFIYPVATTKEVKDKPISSNFIKYWRELLVNRNYYINLNDWYEAIGIEKKQGIINVADCSEILKKLSYKSYESEYKVMIIWMVEKLYYSAAPKILKILEEPPDKTLFILISENQDQIINTILSRTQLVKIPKIKDKDIRQALINIAGLDKTKLDDAIRLANGNMREAVLHMKGEVEDDDLLHLFATWMRSSFTMKMEKIIPVVNDISKKNREQQKMLLTYSLDIIRKAMLVKGASEFFGVRARCSWQPMQLVVSPGWTVRKLCMRFTERSFSSRATRKKLRKPGSSR